MKSNFKIFALLGSLLIFTLGQAAQAAEGGDRTLGHSAYFRAKLSGLSTGAGETAAQAEEKIRGMIGEDKALVASEGLEAKRGSLKKAQAELAELSRKLGASLLKQDATLLIALSGTTLFVTSLAGRIGFEGSEKFVGAVRMVVPDVWGLRWLNKLLLGTRGLIDRFGKATTRLTLISGAVGSVGTLYLFHCEREDVTRFAAEVSKSLDEVEQMMAQIDFVEQSATKKP